MPYGNINLKNKQKPKSFTKFANNKVNNNSFTTNNQLNNLNNSINNKHITNNSHNKIIFN